MQKIRIFLQFEDHSVKLNEEEDAVHCNKECSYIHKKSVR